HAVRARIPRAQYIARKRSRLPNGAATGAARALHVEQRQRKIELFWHDSNDGVRSAVERNLIANNRRIGVESALPQSGADDNHIIAPFRAFSFSENATFYGVRSEQWENAR